jgi:HEAT repeat protein
MRWAISEAPLAVEPLIVALKDLVYYYVRIDAAAALGKLKDPRAAEPLIVSLKDPDRLAQLVLASCARRET